MARKRNGSGMGAGEARERPPTNNGKGNLMLEQDFEDLCKDANIDIPYNVRASPTMPQGSDEVTVWKLYKFLWWQNKSRLREEINSYFRSLPQTPAVVQNSAAKRKALLLERLQGLRAVIPKSARFFKDLETPLPNAGAAVLEPPNALGAELVPEPPPRDLSPNCPTIDIKSFFKTNKAGAATPPPLAKLEAVPSTSAGGISEVVPDPRPASKLARPISNKNQTRPNAQTPSNPLAVNTSFNTSFGQTSFWSNPGSQSSIRTDMTSFSKDDMPPPPRPQEKERDSVALSSLSSATAEELRQVVERLESSQQADSSGSTVKPLEPAVVNTRPNSLSSTEYDTAPNSPLGDRLPRAYRTAEAVSQDSERESSCYGSSLGSSTMNDLEDHVHFMLSTSDFDIPDAPNFAPQIESRDKPEVSLTSLEWQPESTGNGLATPHGFVDVQIPPQFRRLPFEVQWEVYRVLQTDCISPGILDSEWRSKSLDSLEKLVSARRIPMQKSPPRDKLNDWEVLTRSGSFERSTSKTGATCQLVLHAGRKDTSCSLQRWLGADRVLYIEVPDLFRSVDAAKDPNPQAQFCEWLNGSREILGRKWYPFFLQANKKKSVTEGVATAAVHRLVLVAPGDRLSLCDVLEWSLPYSTNNTQAARKAYMRLELLLSRTIPATILEPGEISQVPDQLATREHDDRRYEDPTLRNQFYEEYDPKMIMSDGCNQISYWVAYQYAKQIGLKRVPPALQVRTAGAKGLWYINEPGHRNFDDRPVGPLIKLAPSQIKVARDTFFGCDSETLSVNVVKANPGARPGVLHLGFLPILIDRGVPWSTIRAVIEHQVQRQTQEFLDALNADGSLHLRRWIASNNEFFEARRREHGIDTFAGFPKALEEGIIQMLESGFEPKKGKFLARQMKVLAASYFDLKNKNFKIVLSKSTTLWGIADPVGCLKPGEVCVIFEEPFDVSNLGGRLMFLDNIDILIARNPAMGPSDVQKVRAIYKPELATWAGMVIFPSRGMRPLANKLQGGDYDGDSFWLTWEDSLTAGFKNAPAPWVAPRPEVLGIKVDESKLRDHVQDPHSEQQWCRYLRAMASKRMQNNILGIATLFHERLIYAGLAIGSEEVMRIVHLHDYLVDADKQGYDYTLADFEQYKRSRPLPRNLPNPKYWRYTRYDEAKKKDESRGTVIQPAVPENVIDKVYFEILAPILEATLIETSKILEDAAAYDPDLAHFWNQTMDASTKGSEMHAELMNLKDQLQRIHKEWSSNRRKHGSWDERIERLRAMYEAIQPMNPRNPTVVEWLRRVGTGHTRWEELKASCFAATQYYGTAKPQVLVFRVAAAEMCHLKLNQQDESKRCLLLSHYRALKMRRVRPVESAPDFDEERDVDAVEEIAYN